VGFSASARYCTFGDHVRAVAHKRLELADRNFVNAKVIRPRQSDFMLRAVWEGWIAPRLILRRAHQEPSRRDQVQLHADTVGDLHRHAEPLRFVLLPLLRLFGAQGARRAVGDAEDIDSTVAVGGGEMAAVLGELYVADGAGEFPLAQLHSRI